jgi:antitoxin VapB
MGLNLKNEEAHRLARQLADRTGESMTQAVTTAIRDRLHRLGNAQKEGLVERIIAIGKESAAHLKEPYRSVDHGDLLYDEKGLPR